MFEWLQRWLKSKRLVLATVACSSSSAPPSPPQCRSAIESTIVFSPRHGKTSTQGVDSACDVSEGPRTLLSICIDIIAQKFEEYDGKDLCTLPLEILALVIARAASSSNPSIVNTRSISHLLQGLEGEDETYFLDLDSVSIAAPRRSCKDYSKDHCSQDDWLMTSLLTRLPRARHIEANGFMITDASLMPLDAMSGLKRSITTLDLSHCPLITDLSLSILVTLPSLSSLTLRGCQGIIGGAFKSIQCPHLRKLDLASCSSLHCGVKHGISNLPNLDHLDLSFCLSLPDDELVSLSRLWLNGNKGITHLMLRSTSISSASMRNIIGLAGQKCLLKPLVHLDLRQCNISDSAFIFVDLEPSSDDPKCHLPHLEWLNVSGCKRLKDEGLVHIASLVKNGSLKHLSLSKTSVTDSGLIFFGSKVSSIQSLELDSCHVGDRGVAAMLRSCTRIKHLDLSETLAGDKTLNLIHQLSLPPPFPPLWLRQAADADACEPRLSLSHLNLSWTRVTNSGCADSLSALTSLSHLNLDSGSLTDHALASLPPSLTSLLCFSLRCHDAPGASLISKASQLLQRLELCGGFLGDDGLLEVGKLTHLTNLNISQNPRITDKGIVNLLGTSFPPNAHRSSPHDHDSSTSSSLSSSSSSSESNEVKPRSRGIFALKDLALAGTRVTLSKTNQYGQEAMSLLLGLEHLSSLCLSNTAVSREDVELFCHERKRYESAPSSRQHCVVKWEALPH